MPYGYCRIKSNRFDEVDIVIFQSFGVHRHAESLIKNVYVFRNKNSNVNVLHRYSVLEGRIIILYIFGLPDTRKHTPSKIVSFLLSVKYIIF